MLTYLITRCHGLMTRLLSPQIINTLASVKNFQEIIDILNPTEYGKDIRELELINAFSLEEIFNKKLMDRCEYLLKAAPDNINEFLIAYYRKFEIQNILRLFRGKISKVPIEISDYALFPTDNISSIDIEAMAQATDAEEFILNLKKTPYDQVIKSIEWYRKYDSFLPIEFHLKNIYYNMLFQALTQLSLEDRKKVSQLIRAEVDITNCFTSTAASVYGYDIEFIDSLLIPYPLRLSLKTLGEVIRTNSPQEILGLLGPYSKIAKYLLSRDETAANTESLRLLRRETIRQRIEESMNFSYVMHYIFSSQFECRDLTFITLAVQHNINPADYLSY